MPNASILPAVALFAILFTFAVVWPSFAQYSEPVVSNVQFTVRGNYVDITYDLEQAEGITCIVDPVLIQDNNPIFSIPYSSITGDFGKDVAPGTGKKITWNALIDFPDELLAGVQIRVAARLDEQIYLLPGGVPLTMVWIPGGTYLMGR